MKKFWKRLSTRVLPVLLSVLFLFVFTSSALAKSDKPEHDTGKPAWAGENNGKQDKNQNQDRTKDSEKKTYRGISTEKIALAIASVTDEETRLSLSALLDAYIAALSDKDAALDSGKASLSVLSKAASSARSALKDALEEAGFTLGSVLGWQEWKDYGNEALDLEGIALAIASLDDADVNKQALTALLAAYESALAALETATGEEQEALEEAAKEARESLLEALYTSGLYPLAIPEETPVTVDPAT